MIKSSFPERTGKHFIYNVDNISKTPCPRWIITLRS